MLTAHAQVIARIVVAAGSYKRENTPVSLELNGITALPDTAMALVEIKNGQRRSVPFQVEEGYTRSLWWILSGTSAPGTQRVFELIESSPVRPAPVVMQATDRDGTLLLQEGNQSILQYNYATVYPPAGVDSVFQRSGFIHPLWAPNGAVLTHIHPRDHWHHVGIWNPWTHTEFEGKEVDFWNLVKKQGTVRFAGFQAQTQGPVWSGFKALQEHVVMKGQGKEQVALNEVWDVRAYPAQAGGARRIWDFTSVFGCAGPSPLLLEQYRYGGGFGFRGTPEWTTATSQILTSEGRTRKDADSTRARWIKVTGETGKGRAGMLVLCYPSNFDAPEPVRVWTENMERGEVFINFSPTKMRSWLLTYGKQYTLKYRIMIYNDDITAAEADAIWNDLAHPPVVKVENVR
ncbi:DUF6807 domain-containing protein [Chitinophaga japonensis]|uniref:Methane monooxygenase PmoA-like n=1 Tax=Chitinophaga japonensis TaxID=104662 RepID=A0A562T5J8_CHIJA|nr:PmoA family protein [Chitinophaga japonensis]TWI88643.1 methane monooxygenase PmoA-like [Chitinophaga japonensis]